MQRFSPNWKHRPLSHSKVFYNLNFVLLIFHFPLNLVPLDCLLASLFAPLWEKRHLSHSNSFGQKIYKSPSVLLEFISNFILESKTANIILWEWRTKCSCSNFFWVSRTILHSNLATGSICKEAFNILSLDNLFPNLLKSNIVKTFCDILSTTKVEKLIHSCPRVLIPSKIHPCSLKVVTVQIRAPLIQGLETVKFLK